MKKPLFTGVCTAMVTPFLDDTVNYPMLEMLLRRQMEAGISAVVLAGTTGEGATLSDVEKLRIFERSKRFAGDGLTVIAGTGSNDTAHAVRLSLAAQEAGADGLLVVSPYYNRATPDGLITHYCAIAQAVHIPIIVYNVPTRTGVDIPVSVYKALSHVPNIIGVKEASTDLEKVLRIRRECGQDFYIWSGNDSLAVPVLSLGGQGLISVASNLVPEKIGAMVDAGLDGDFDTAADLQCRLLPLTDAMFWEVNPIPVKAAMAHIGFDCGPCRLPLTPLTAEHQKKLEQLLG